MTLKPTELQSDPLGSRLTASPHAPGDPRIYRQAEAFGVKSRTAIFTLVVLALVPLLSLPSSFAQPTGPRPARAPRAPTRAPTRPPTRAPQGPGGAPPPAAAEAGAPGGDAPLPGEREFNSCRLIPANRRVKITLKPGSDLNDLVKWISSMTCRKFIVADALRSQKVTIFSPVPVTAAEAYRAFLSALEVMGLTVVPTSKYLKVVQANWAIQSPIKTYGNEDTKRIPDSDEVVTQILQVQSVDVNELLLVLNKMKSRSGDITAYKTTNSLIITDSGANVRRLAQIVKELDVSVEGEKIWIIRLKVAAVEEVNKILSQIFAQQQGAGRPIVRMPRPPGQPPAPGQENTDAGDLTASKIVPDPTTNSLIIVASPAAFLKISSLIKKLDIEGEGANQRIHVYYLENADADEMAQTLSGLASGGGGARPPGGGRAGARGGAPRAPSGPATLFEGDVKVSADKATNSLVIVASAKDFLNLRQVIKMLDIPRRQVFVEATILEVSLDRGRKLGVAYHGGGITGEGSSQAIIFGGVEHKDWNSLTFNPLALMGLAVGARGAPIAGSAQLMGTPADVPAFGVMFQALQNSNDVNVLSSPHILTTDNEEAEITVGQNVPFQGGFMGGGFGGLPGAGGQANPLGAMAGFLPGVSVQRQDVALKLKLTPHVNDSDMVRLELEQEVSDIASQNFNGLGPSTSKRSAKTVVVVQDQQTVVIGGLMSNRTINTVSKVPLLGDIPILGYFFKYTDRSVQKTNLLIVLTPYVIRDQSDLRRIFQKKLEERREFIERYTAFEHREITEDIDFRHKRGLLAEINRVAIQSEKEAELLDAAKEKSEQPVEGLEIPKELVAPPAGTAGSSEPGTSAGTGETGAGTATPADVRPPGDPRTREPRIDPNRSIRLRTEP